MNEYTHLHMHMYMHINYIYMSTSTSILPSALNLGLRFGWRCQLGSGPAYFREFCCPTSGLSSRRICVLHLEVKLAVVPIARTSKTQNIVHAFSTTCNSLPLNLAALLLAGDSTYIFYEHQFFSCSLSLELGWER